MVCQKLSFGYQHVIHLSKSSQKVQIRYLPAGMRRMVCDPGNPRA